MSGVFTPGCSSRVLIASCRVLTRNLRRSVRSRQIRRSSTAACDSGYSGEARTRGDYLDVVKKKTKKKHEENFGKYDAGCTYYYAEEMIDPDFNVRLVQEVRQLPFERVYGVADVVAERNRFRETAGVDAYQPAHDDGLEPL